MTVHGSCHCGATRFELPSAPTEATACTCSFCSKRGALWAYYPVADVKLEPQSSHAVYRWQSMTVKHGFCPTCGCTTLTETPDWSNGEPDFDNMRYAVNIRLLDDFDVGAVPVTVIDGKNLW